MLIVVILLVALTSSTHQMQINGKNTSMVRDSENLYGQHLRVSVFHVSIFNFYSIQLVLCNYLIMRAQYPPFFMVSQGKDGNATYSGYCFNIIDWMTQQYKLR